MHAQGFYYSRYDDPKQDNKRAAVNEYHKLYYHRVGTPQSEDQLVFGGTSTSGDDARALNDIGRGDAEHTAERPAQVRRVGEPGSVRRLGQRRAGGERAERLAQPKPQQV